MESPRKFNDCYFYYYSTCTKGDNCVFRHEPTALGCEAMCTQWQQGKCLDTRCKYRHMELKKNRKQIACYWESQPGGCRKKHCPFQHKDPDARTDGIAPSQPNSPLAEGGAHEGSEIPQEQVVLPHELMWQEHQRQAAVIDSAILSVLPASSNMLPHMANMAGVGRRVLPPHHGGPHPAHPAHLPHMQPQPYPAPAQGIESLVVNFDEESDSESIPSATPTKMMERCVRGKSVELQQLERIQAEAAAFYSYESASHGSGYTSECENQNGSRVPMAYASLTLDEMAGRRIRLKEPPSNSVDFKVLTLKEIRAKRFSMKSNISLENKESRLQKRKLGFDDPIPDVEINDTNLDECLKVFSANSEISERKIRKVDQSKRRVVKPKDSKLKLIRHRLTKDTSESSTKQMDSQSDSPDEDKILNMLGNDGSNIPDIVASCNLGNSSVTNDNSNDSNDSTMLSYENSSTFISNYDTEENSCDMVLKDIDDFLTDSPSTL